MKIMCYDYQNDTEDEEDIDDDDVYKQTGAGEPIGEKHSILAHEYRAVYQWYHAIPHNTTIIRDEYRAVYNAIPQH